MNKMNKNNLIKLLKFMPSINPIIFNMQFYRPTEDRVNIECSTIGCIIGHATILFPQYIERIEDEIYFKSFMRNAFNLSYYHEQYLFGAVWAENPITATLEYQTAKLKSFIDNDFKINLEFDTYGIEDF